ncbi:hypothetical protein F4781DRAFT_357485 [Annulohypoxylon bovei var. microspora]|nr:hypothetical protein F4781DRAFT_357485 [Annulohypoxylon bovei var. microspora]
MFFFLALAALLVWFVVLTLKVASNIRLLLQTTRWAVTLYMGLLGLPLCLAFREGLVALGAEESSISNALAMWTLWYVWVAASVISWPFAVPAVIILAKALSSPWIRMVLDYGLVRLSWVEWVHNPMWYLVKGSWQLWVAVMLGKGQESHQQCYNIERNTALPSK